MATYTIKTGLDLPIKGEPAEMMEAGRRVGHVAIMNDDFPFMKPRMDVAVGVIKDALSTSDSSI